MKNNSLIESILFPPTKVNRKKLLQAITGKTILITGASSGIGEQLAYALAPYDTHLILVARRQEKLQEIKEIIEKQKAKVTVIPADLRDDADMERLLHILLNIENGIHFIVSNAGKSILRSIFDSLDRYHDFTRTMAINYFAPVRLFLALIPTLEKHNGHIIHTSTINAILIPFPKWAAYQASKTAFDVWFQSVQPELNSKNIQTTTLYLPLVRTPMIEPTKATNTCQR